MEGEPTYDIAGLKFVKKCKEINFVLKVQKLVQSQNISVLFSEEISSFSKLLASLFDRQFIVSVAKVNQSNVQLLKSNFGCLCNSMEKSSIQIFLKRGWDMYLMKTSHKNQADLLAVGSVCVKKLFYYLDF